MKKSLKVFVPLLVLVLVAVIGWVLYDRGIIQLPDGDAEKQVVIVPIELNEADELGPMTLFLDYDPEVLKVVKVKPGKLAKNAMFQTSDEVPGRLIMMILTTEAINGDGQLAEITFEVKKKADSPLTLEVREVYQYETQYELISTTTPGSYSSEGEIASPTLSFERS